MCTEECREFEGRFLRQTAIAEGAPSQEGFGETSPINRTIPSGRQYAKNEQSFQTSFPTNVGNVMGPGRFPRSAGEMSRSDKRGRPACGVARRRSSAPVRWATRAMRRTSRLAGRLIGLRCPRLWCSADIIPYLCKKRKTKYTNVYRQKSR